MLWNGAKAQRQPLHPRPRFARRALQTVCVLLAAQVAGVARADGLKSAQFEDPTRRYGHAVLGDDIEYGTLRLKVSGRGADDTYIVLPEDHVFEDIAPRLVDLDGDGTSEVMVVETDVALGAQLAVYSTSGEKIAQTPHIGRRHRWLAPIGAADLDGDGFVEVAYVDRPHLAKTLRVWRYRDGALHEVAALRGVTNHRIGQDFITSGIRDCGDGPELVTADAGWDWVVATRLQDDTLHSHQIAPITTFAAFNQLLSCAK